jgi:hypothetical protein
MRENRNIRSLCHASPPAIHGALERLEADGVDPPGQSPRSLGHRNQGGLLEQVGLPAPYGGKLVLYVADAFVLGKAFQVVAVEDATHDGPCLVVVQFLKETFLPTDHHGEHLRL